LQKIEETQVKISDKEGEIQKVKDEFNLQENDVAAAKQDIETEVVEETKASEKESHGKSSDPDTPKS
jgi:peptidoglycan hydrolase CwlO-like protein